jgi:hypothetical protein
VLGSESEHGVSAFRVLGLMNAVGAGGPVLFLLLIAWCWQALPL